MDEPQKTHRRQNAIRAWTKKPSAEEDLIREEAKHFLGILEQRITEMTACSLMVNDDLSFLRLDDYLRFRDLMSACWTFSILIENRIGQLEDDTVPELLDKFDQLTVAIWSVLIRGALKFFRIVSQEDYLPLGSREIFMRELKTLYDADRLFVQERYRNRIDADTMADLETSEKILSEIIEKAPRLLEIWR